MKVLNIGSLNYDYVYTVKHIVEKGETISSQNMEVFCGGKGLNQSIALSKAGVPVYHAGLIGEEGELFLQECLINGVNTTYIKQILGKSGHTIIQVDEQAQNCIILFGGANQKFSKEYIDAVLKNFEKGDILLLQNEINELNYIIDRAYEIGLQIVLNPSPYNEKMEQCNLSKISVFMMNEIEGEQITGEKEPEKIMQEIKNKYPEAKVVLTLGSNGVMYQYKDEVCHQGIFEVKAVDTTAAGDTFTGYFIATMIEEMPIKEALRLCAKASSITVSRKGATQSIPFRSEVEHRLQ
ncbi:MAG: ribokinase [Lachnotalea sp.]